MGFIWDYKSKKKLFEIVKQKLFDFDKKEFPHIKILINSSLRKKYNKKISKYLDDLGCIRIVKVKISGWELEDSEEAENPKLPWKSLNDSRYVHIENPMSLIFFNDKKHLIRIPKEVAEKFIILGMP